MFLSLLVFICVCASLCVWVLGETKSMGCLFGGHGNGAKPTRFRRVGGEEAIEILRHDTTRL
jgi:hypothetical protein